MRNSLTTLFLMLGLIAGPVMAEQATPTGRRVLALDYSVKRLAMVDLSGKVLWQRETKGSHDLHLLPNGNVLVGDGWTKIIEVQPALEGKAEKVVWEYDRTDGKKVEIHAFQRLTDGNTMIAESGPARIIEVDKDGKLVKEIKLKTKNPSTHSDTRLARKLDNGNYLVCQEADSALREYNADGKVVWEYEVPLFDKKPAGGHGPEAWGNKLFGAVRLPSGNTLIATGNGHSVIEVTPAKEVVWHLKQDDIPGVTLAWVTTLQVLPSGNIVIGNCHAGDNNPQIVEVTREKKLVWQYKDFKLFGNAMSNNLVTE